MSGALGGAAGWLSGTSGAAEGTDAAGEYEALVSSFGRAVADFGEQTDALARAVAAAAACYEAGDRLPTLAEIRARG